MKGFQIPSAPDLSSHRCLQAGISRHQDGCHQEKNWVPPTKFCPNFCDHPRDGPTSNTGELLWFGFNLKSRRLSEKKTWNLLITGPFGSWCLPWIAWHQISSIFHIQVLLQRLGNISYLLGNRIVPISPKNHSNRSTRLAENFVASGTVVVNSQLFKPLLPTTMLKGILATPPKATPPKNKALLRLY